MGCCHTRGQTPEKMKSMSLVPLLWARDSEKERLLFNLPLKAELSAEVTWAVCLGFGGSALARIVAVL